MKFTEEDKKQFAEKGISEEETLCCGIGRVWRCKI